MNIIMLVKNLWVFMFVVLGMVVAYGEELQIEALKVYSDEKKGVIKAEGNVHITKERDILNSDVAHVYVDAARKPIKFEAIGNVDFVLFTEDGRELKGKSNTLIYLVPSNEYQLIGKAEVQEIGKPNFIKGEKITLNNKSGYANVESNNVAPVRVIIDLNDAQSPNNEQKPPSK